MYVCMYVERLVVVVSKFKAENRNSNAVCLVMHLREKEPD